MDSYCCTGGGGAMSMSEYANKRLEVASVKAEQIKATGAGICATACHNCVDGLSDLIKKYELKYDKGDGKQKLIPVPNVCELVANAIVVPGEVKEKVQRVRPQLQGKKILVIDDEPDIVTYLEALFEDNGYVVITAKNGAAGIEKARREKPDLITLDYQMPGQDGASVFKQMREDPELQDIPIMVATGAVDFRQLMYQRTTQAPDGFIRKPFDNEVMLATIRRVLEKRLKAREN